MAGGNTPYKSSHSKRIAEGKLQRSCRVAGPPIEVVAVLEADRANDRFPPQAQADREATRIKRIISDACGQAERIRKQNQRPLRRQGLFQFNCAEGKGLGADEPAARIAGLSLAFSI